MKDGARASTSKNYLLTCRLEKDARLGSVYWRYNLEPIQSESRLAFATLEALFEYLRNELGKSGQV